VAYTTSATPECHIRNVELLNVLLIVCIRPHRSAGLPHSPDGVWDQQNRRHSTAIFSQRRHHTGERPYAASRPSL